MSGVRVMIGRLRSAKVNHAVTFSAHSQFISLTCKTGYPLITGDSFSLATGPRPHEPGRKLLSRVDRDLDCRIRPKVVAVLSMKFRVPMRNPSPDFTDKVKTAFFSQVSEIANQVCDGMLVTGSAADIPRWPRRPRQCGRLYRSCSFLRGSQSLFCNIIKSNRIIALWGRR